MLLLLNQKPKSYYYRKLLNEEGRQRRDRNLIRAALHDPQNSTWEKCFSSGDDGVLITVTGFDHATFNFMLSHFTPLFTSYTPWCSKVGGVDGLNYRKLSNEEKRGKKRMVTAKACLGLVLAWYRFRGAEFVLQGWFGFTGTQCNVWLRFGRRMLLKALLSIQEAKVQFPSEETIKDFQKAIRQRHIHLNRVYCFADGLKLPFEACSGLLQQGMYYNGWTHGHYITNVFVFGADGTIIDAVLNVPGSVHDSQVASWGGMYDRLKEVYQRTGAICVVDSAFASANVPYLIRSSDDLTKAADPFEREVMTDATSLRQAAEWGMRAIQSAFPRLKDHISYEENGERTVILKLLPLLYNLRCNKVGLNQIRNTYMLSLSKDADYYIQRPKET